MQFRILGPLEVIDDGRVLTISGRKQRTLLALLLLHANQTVSRDRLIDELWGEDAPETAAHRLEEHVSRLRRVIHSNGETPVVTQPAGYMLRIGNHSLDVSEFDALVQLAETALENDRLHSATEQFREALALWRGAPLADLDRSPRPEIRRLEERHNSVCEHLMEAELALGRHEYVLTELEGLVEREPLRERFRFLLMLALYRAGRQGDALAAYQRARRTLTEELGIEPGQKLRELEQKILRQDASLELFERDGRPLRPPVPRARVGNLPRPATSLVGRQRELDEIVASIERGNRFVTLTGPGGCGKTRLALESAYRAVPDFKDGVFFVDLAPLRNPGLVSNTIAQTVGARRRLAEHVGDRRVLLVVDNFEQVTDAAPDLASVVRECPNLHVLVTSRELLHVGAESGYEIVPLSDAEAIELFCVRGRVRPDESVAELCRRLDNLPLAIEFAAARTSVLSPRQILDRIAQRLDLLKGPRDGDTRQRTLRTTVEWSHELLSSEEQLLLVRLAVFAGGWTLDASEDVAGASLDTLQSLVEKSLVHHEGERFSMLETTREFAFERLQASGECAEVERRHAEYFLRLTEDVEPTLLMSDPARSNASFSAELDNFRRSLAYAQSAHDGDMLERLAGALGWFWNQNGLHDEGRVWLQEALEAGGAPTAARTRVLFNLTTIAELDGEHEVGRNYARRMLELASARGDTKHIFFALLNLGLLSDDLGQAESFLERSARIARESDDERLLAFVATNVGSRSLLAHAYERAFARSEEAAEQWDRLGHPMLRAIALTNAGSASRELGHLTVAAERLAEGLRLGHALGVTVLHQVGAIAALALAQRQFDRAARLTGIAQRLCEQGFIFEPFEFSVHERTMAELEKSMDKDALEAALSEGAALPFDEAVPYALEMCRPAEAFLSRI